MAFLEDYGLPGIPAWLIFISIAVIGYYKYFVWNFGIFKELGIKGPKPYPVIGTMIPMIREGALKHDLDLRKYGNVVGQFQGRQPVMMIYDREILKHILIKDFSNFTNRFDLGLTEYPLRKMLTILKDEHWKHVRNHLTPTFSSGKLRKMNGKVLQCIETLLSNFEKKAETKEIFNYRDLCSAFTMDVIASTAFGLKIDSHNDPNNQFVQMGKKVFNFSFANVKTLILFFFPFLINPLVKLGFSVFPKDAIKFFTAAVDKAIAERQETNKDDVDFLQLMMNASQENEDFSKNGDVVKKEKEETWQKNRGLSHEEVLAQGILFFLAGYDTTAATMSFMGYSLATNPEVQERLLKEVDETMKDQKQVTFDLVHKMTYLDMCLSEVLRLYPLGFRTDRIARQDTNINGVFIPKGMMVGVPIYALQNDPEVWPNPEKFDPERFTQEAKEERDPMSYFPFGLGPRNCVGMRLALMEMKMSTVCILQKFKFLACEETEVPLKLDKLRMHAVNGIRVRVEKR